MDGLLIDSEDIYTKITNEVLHMYGKPDLPWSIKAQLQGRPQPEVCILFPLVYTPKDPTLTIHPGQQNLPRLGKAAHYARRDSGQAVFSPGRILSVVWTSARSSCPTLQPRGNPVHRSTLPHRIGNILQQQEFQAEDRPPN